MGIALQKSGNFLAATKSYKQTLKFQPNQAKAYYNMGSAYKEMNDPYASLKCYKQALKIEPNYKEVYYNIGDLIRRMEFKRIPIYW